MNCDNCKFYHWYTDWCDKWKCEVDAREVHNCFEKYESTPIFDAMIGKQSEAMNENLFEQAEEVDLFKDLTAWEKFVCNVKAWIIILLHRITI